MRRTVGHRRASIVLYHDPDPVRFAEHLRYLSRRYTLIPLATLVAAIESGDWDGVPERALVVTLDDGWERTRSLRPTCAEVGARPTMYLCSAPLGSDRTLWFDGLPAAEVERLKSLPDSERRAELVRQDPPFTGTRPRRRTLSAEEARELAEHWDLGSHGREHATLPRCSPEVAVEEVRRSRTELEDLVARPCRDFAFPAGAYGPREIELVKAAGYRSARTVDIGWNGPKTDPFRLKVLSIDPPTTTRLVADLSGLKWLSRLAAGKGHLDGRRRFRFRMEKTTPSPGAEPSK